MSETHDATPPGRPTPGATGVIPLADGRRVRVRPISSHDGDALVRFHSRLSAESTRLRFFSPHPRLSPREVERFTHVDHHRREALVATHGRDIIAVARFDRLGDSDEAEVAFVVADDWRRLGLAGALLARLSVRGRQEGIARFVAETLPENHPMLDVFAAAGHPLSRSLQGGVVNVAFPIT